MARCTSATSACSRLTASKRTELSAVAARSARKWSRSVTFCSRYARALRCERVRRGGGDPRNEEKSSKVQADQDVLVRVVVARVQETVSDCRERTNRRR